MTIPFQPIPCGGDDPACCAPAVATTGLCLGDGTPIAVVTSAACGECGEDPTAPATTGWLHLLTGVFTAGAPPVGSRACGEELNFELGGLLCDVQPDGSSAATVVIEFEYDDQGQLVGTRVLNVVDGSVYVPTGTLLPCNNQPEAMRVGEVCYQGAETPGDFTLAASTSPHSWSVGNFAGLGETLTITQSPQNIGPLQVNAGGGIGIAIGYTGATPVPQSDLVTIDLGRHYASVELDLEAFGTTSNDRLRDITPAPTALTGAGTLVGGNGINPTSPDGNVTITFPGTQVISFRLLDDGSAPAGVDFARVARLRVTDLRRASTVRQPDDSTAYYDTETGALVAAPVIVDCPCCCGDAPGVPLGSVCYEAGDDFGTVYQDGWLQSSAPNGPVPPLATVLALPYTSQTPFGIGTLGSGPGPITGILRNSLPTQLPGAAAGFAYLRRSLTLTRPVDRVKLVGVADDIFQRVILDGVVIFDYTVLPPQGVIRTVDFATELAAGTHDVILEFRNTVAPNESAYFDARFLWSGSHTATAVKTCDGATRYYDDATGIELHAPEVVTCEPAETCAPLVLGELCYTLPGNEAAARCPFSVPSGWQITDGAGCDLGDDPGAGAPPAGGPGGGNQGPVWGAIGDPVDVIYWDQSGGFGLTGWGSLQTGPVTMAAIFGSSPAPPGVYPFTVAGIIGHVTIYQQWVILPTGGWGPASAPGRIRWAFDAPVNNFTIGVDPGFGDGDGAQALNDVRGGNVNTVLSGNRATAVRDCDGGVTLYDLLTGLPLPATAAVVECAGDGDGPIFAGFVCDVTPFTPATLATCPGTPLATSEPVTTVATNVAAGPIYEAIDNTAEIQYGPQDVCTVELTLTGDTGLAVPTYDLVPIWSQQSDGTTHGLTGGGDGDSAGAMAAAMGVGPNGIAAPGTTGTIVVGTTTVTLTIDGPGSPRIRPATGALIGRQAADGDTQPVTFHLDFNPPVHNLYFVYGTTGNDDTGTGRGLTGSQLALAAPGTEASGGSTRVKQFRNPDGGSFYEDLDGTPHTVAGTIGTCEENTDSVILCDFGTVDPVFATVITARLLRTFYRDAAGNLLRTEDTDLSTGEPYVPLVGGFGITPCGDVNTEVEMLCDLGALDGPGGTPHLFYRNYQFDADSGGFLGTNAFDLQTGMQYLVVGPVAPYPCTGASSAGDVQTPTTVKLCDITEVPTLEGARSALDLTALPPGPTAGAFPNGIGYTVDQGFAGGSGTYLITTNTTQTWTFTEPAMLRFGVNNLNVGAECVTLPVGTVVESIHPNHTYNAGTRVLCNGGAASPADESIFTLAGATSLPITSNAGGGGQRGLVRLEAGRVTIVEVLTPFLRTICRICGEAPVVTDTTLDAVTPYVPVGTVGVCDGPSDGCLDSEIIDLCYQFVGGELALYDETQPGGQGWIVSMWPNGNAAPFPPDNGLGGAAVGVSISPGLFRLAGRADTAAGQAGVPTTSGYAKTFLSAGGTGVLNLGAFSVDDVVNSILVNGVSLPVVVGSVNIDLLPGVNTIEIRVDNTVPTNTSVGGELTLEVPSGTIPFRRVIAYDCQGMVATYADYSADGVTAIEAPGPVGTCATTAETNPNIEATLTHHDGVGAQAVAVPAGARSVTLTVHAGTIDVQIGVLPLVVLPPGSYTWAVDQGGPNGERLAQPYSFAGGPGDVFTVHTTREV